MSVLTKVIEEHVPFTTPSPYSKRWWTKELERERRQVQRLRNRSYHLRDVPDHPVHKEWRRARNKYGEHIDNTKQEHWSSFIEDADNESIWTVSKFMRADATDGGRTRVPPLRPTTVKGAAEPVVTGNDGKSRILYDTFFPPAGAPPVLPEGHQYPVPKFTLSPITDLVLCRAGLSSPSRAGRALLRPGRAEPKPS